jgi:CBS domain-containing protein
VDTADISYRVADFLKKHPPFTAVEDADLLALAARGRVRFHEPSEYILWQGEPHRHHVFVIQQGTVSLWDETGGRSILRDVRGAGDMLGIERYNDAPHCPHTVRSESEVVIYSFPQDDFSQFILKYAHAVQYISAEERLTADYQSAGTRRDPHRTFLHFFVGHRPLATCRATDAVAHVAQRLLDARADAVAVLDGDGLLHSVVTSDTLLGWVAAGGGDAGLTPAGALLDDVPAVVPPQASVSDGVIAMNGSAVNAVALTADGTRTGRLQAVITPADLAPLFGEHPSNLLREIRRSGSVGELRELNQRARALTLEYLTTAGAVEWLATLTHAIDVAIIGRLLAFDGVTQPRECWCVAGAAGRGESLTKLAPHVVIIANDSDDLATVRARHRRVLDGLAECDYLAHEQPFAADFYAAGSAEWKERFHQWLRDPVMQQTYRARTLFDLRPVLGPRVLWQELDAAVTQTADRNVLHVLANDCLASLPPLTFYQDAVVDQVGEHVSIFRLDESALRPLVDVGRVFGLAGGAALGRSTLTRFETARSLLPAHERIFREAAETFRVVLWQQGRVGIIQGTTGAELPPRLLSRHDRHALKSGFRSILELLEFTAERSWLESL